MDKISVIMPCYNAEGHVARGVSSVLGQTYRDVELVVVNDGSTDRTADILSTIDDPRLKVISQPNRGVSAARNRGLEEITGVFVAFLDADDTWRPDCLELLHRALEKAPEAVLAYCGWQNVGLTGGRGEPYIPPDYQAEGKLEHLLRSCPWPIHAALTCTEAIHDAGRFDEHYSHAEDYKLWLEIVAAGKIVRVPEVLAFYYFHGGVQATGKRGKTAIDNWRVQREFIEAHPEIEREIGKDVVRNIVEGNLLKRGFECFWARDLPAAHSIFRRVMKNRYGTLKEWKYMLVALLPLPLFQMLTEVVERKR
jgi:glycosyltransferase involved in cell wall biosynthesis